jgi:hypothetical protein
MHDEGTEIRRNLRPPDTLDRLSGPFIGLGIVVLLTVMTYRAALSSSLGGPMPDPRGGSHVLQMICYAFARILGPRGTLIVGSLAAATQVVAIARAFRTPAALPTQPPRTDVVHAFASVRRRCRALDFVQLLSALAITGLSLVSNEGAVAPVAAVGVVGSVAMLIATNVLQNRIWKCPACGGWPGNRRAMTCATCERPIA